MFSGRLFGLSAVVALPCRVPQPLRWLPPVASSLARHQRPACGKLPLPSRARACRPANRSVL